MARPPSRGSLRRDSQQPKTVPQGGHRSWLLQPGGPPLVENIYALRDRFGPFDNSTGDQPQQNRFPNAPWNNRQCAFVAPYSTAAVPGPPPLPSLQQPNRNVAAERAPAISDTSYVSQILGTAGSNNNTTSTTTTSTDNPNYIEIRMFRFGNQNENAQNAAAFTGIQGTSSNFAKDDEALADFAALNGDIPILEDKSADDMARDKENDDVLRTGLDILGEITGNAREPNAIQGAKGFQSHASEMHEDGGIKSAMGDPDFPGAVIEWEDRPPTPNGGPHYLAFFHAPLRMAEKYRAMGDDLDLKRDLRSPPYYEADYENPGTPPTPGGQIEDDWNKSTFWTDPAPRKLEDLWQSMSPTYHKAKKAAKTEAIAMVNTHNNAVVQGDANAATLNVADLKGTTLEELKAHAALHPENCKHPLCQQAIRDAGRAQSQAETSAQAPRTNDRTTNLGIEALKLTEHTQC